MDMSYLASYYYPLIGIGVGLYLLFYFLYRRSIVSISDPLNTGLALVAFYLAGALILPWLYPVNWSYVCIVILIFIYIAAGALFSRKRRPAKMPRLAVKPGPQLLFTVALTGLLVLNLIMNQIFGVIPLLQGVQSHSAAVPEPSLYLLAPDIAVMLLLVFLLTEIRKVRLVAGTGVAVSFLSTILAGSKSAIFIFLGALLVTDYVLHLKLNSSHLKDERLVLTRKIRTVRKAAIICAVVILALLPAYLVLIGADSGGGAGGGVENMITRLFGGFDGLAIIAFKNIDIMSIRGVNISDFYFYPFIKKLSHTPEFQSTGPYLIYLLSGSSEFATSGLNPNSSFPIELLLSNGSLVISGVLITLTAAVVFRLRSVLLVRGGVRMIDLVFWILLVLGPFSVLLDGSYYIIKSYLLLGLYMALNLVVTAITWLRPGRKVFRLF